MIPYYLKTIHKYDEALSTINIILDRTQDPDDMNLKADILIMNNLQAKEDLRFLIYTISVSALLLIVSLILIRFLKRTHILKKALEEEQVCFIVTDNGPGIPEDKREKIFDRFEKPDEYSQGTGLGLTICRTIAEQLGGLLFVDPNYTGGTRIILIHPFEIPKPVPES